MESCKILLVDDEVDFLSTLSKRLAKRGADTASVYCGEDALDYLDTHAVDVVVLDVKMPGMDGLETTREIRRRESGSSSHHIVVAMTANVMEEARRECLDAGMDGYIAKPVTLEVLRSGLEKWLHPAETQFEGES